MRCASRTRSPSCCPPTPSRARPASPAVRPPHPTKGGPRRFGAEPLPDAAELIESPARFCVEPHRFPAELVPQVVELRKLFNQTVELFEKETNPLVTRGGPGGFGRKTASNQSFGRI